MSTALDPANLRRSTASVLVARYGLTAARLAALAVTAGLMAVLPWDRSAGYGASAYLSFVLSLGFAHYAASLIYARRQIDAISKHVATRIALGALLALSAAMYLLPKNQEIALIAYFGVHHVFNEVYLSHRALGTAFAPVVRLRIAAMALNGALYVAVLAREPLVAYFAGPKAISVAVGVTAAAFVWELMRTSRYVPRASLANLLSLEVGGAIVAVAVLAFGLQLRFIDVVLYHFVFWALYPAIRIATARGFGPLTRYATLNALLLAGAFALSPASVLRYNLVGSPFLEGFYLFSYLHISASFALSDQHPNWVIALFRRPRTLIASPQ